MNYALRDLFRFFIHFYYSKVRKNPKLKQNSKKKNVGSFTTSFLYQKRLDQLTIYWNSVEKIIKNIFQSFRNNKFLLNHFKSSLQQKMTSQLTQTLKNSFSPQQSESQKNTLIFSSGITEQYSSNDQKTKKFNFSYSNHSNPEINNTSFKDNSPLQYSYSELMNYKDSRNNKQIQRLKGQDQLQNELQYQKQTNYSPQAKSTKNRKILNRPQYTQQIQKSYNIIKNQNMTQGQPQSIKSFQHPQSAGNFYQYPAMSSQNEQIREVIKSLRGPKKYLSSQQDSQKSFQIKNKRQKKQLKKYQKNQKENLQKQQKRREQFCQNYPEFIVEKNQIDLSKRQNIKSDYSGRLFEDAQKNGFKIIKLSTNPEFTKKQHLFISNRKFPKQLKTVRFRLLAGQNDESLYHEIDFLKSSGNSQNIIILQIQGNKRQMSKEIMQNLASGVLKCFPNLQKLVLISGNQIFKQIMKSYDQNQLWIEKIIDDLPETISIQIVTEYTKQQVQKLHSRLYKKFIKNGPIVIKTERRKQLKKDNQKSQIKSIKKTQQEKQKVQQTYQQLLEENKRIKEELQRSKFEKTSYRNLESTRLQDKPSKTPYQFQRPRNNKNQSGFVNQERKKYYEGKGYEKEQLKYSEMKRKQQLIMQENQRRRRQQIIAQQERIKRNLFKKQQQSRISQMQTQKKQSKHYPSQKQDPKNQKYQRQTQKKFQTPKRNQNSKSSLNQQNQNEKTQPKIPQNSNLTNGQIQKVQTIIQGGTFTAQKELNFGDRAGDTIHHGPTIHHNHQHYYEVVEERERQQQKSQVGRNEHQMDEQKPSHEQHENQQSRSQSFCYQQSNSGRSHNSYGNRSHSYSQPGSNNQRSNNGRYQERQQYQSYGNHYEQESYSYGE